MHAIGFAPPVPAPNGRRCRGAGPITGACRSGPQSNGRMKFLPPAAKNDPRPAGFAVAGFCRSADQGKDLEPAAETACLTEGHAFAKTLPCGLHRSPPESRRAGPVRPAPEGAFSVPDDATVPERHKNRECPGEQYGDNAWHTLLSKGCPKTLNKAFVIPAKAGIQVCQGCSGFARGTLRGTLRTFDRPDRCR